MNQEILKMPKVELHCHLDGSLTLASVREILGKDISPEELTERFVRGDKSRTTEGSGLGLSIARSFTEIQGGIFNLEIDGDLFKAVIKLPLDIDLSKGAEHSNEESAAQTAEMPEFRTSAQPE